MIEITVLGEALWDLYPASAGDDLRTRRTEHRCIGGAPANVACTLARLGIDVAMIAAVGDDPLGDGLRDELCDAGVDISNVMTVRARTGITFVELVHGVPRFVPFRSPSADMLLPREAVPEHVGWLHLGSSSFATARAATELAVQRAKVVSIDLNIYPFLFRKGVEGLGEIIAKANVLKASDSDLRALGLSPDRAGAAALHARRRARITIATFGGEGALAFSGDTAVEHAANHEPVVDASGAGDAFTAGVLAALGRGRPLDEALQLGARLGARAVTAIGSTTALRDLTAERAALDALR
jgi:fructokinase